MAHNWPLLSALLALALAELGATNLSIEPISEEQDINSSPNAIGSDAWYGQLPDKPVDNDVVFQLADLATAFRMPNGREAHLEAFATMDNDAFYNRHQNQVNPENEEETGSTSQSLNKSQRYHWVSIGVPSLVWSTSVLPSGETMRSILEADTDNSEFLMHVQMLTEPQRIALARKASQKYRMKISSDQISHLVLNMFTCHLNFSGTDGTRHSVVGTVTNFDSFPLTVHFPVDTGSDKWEVLKNRHNDSSLTFHCVLLQNNGRKLRSNTLVISQSDVKNSRLLPRLFGSKKSVYVTMEQLEQFATDLMTSMQVVEEYDKSIERFSEDFVLELIKNRIVSEFGKRPFSEAVDQLAAYRLYEGGRSNVNAWNASLKALNNFLIVNPNTSVIMVNPKLRCYNQSQFHVNMSSCELRPLEYLGVQQTAELVAQLRASWIHGRIEVEDQLADLSDHPSSNIGWTLLDGKIVPASLNVTLISLNELTKARTFARIRRQYYDAAFYRSITLYGRRAVIISDDNSPMPSATPASPTSSLTADEINVLLNTMRERIVQQLGAKIDRLETTTRPVRLANEDIVNVAQDIDYRLRRSIYYPLSEQLSNVRKFLNDSCLAVSSGSSNSSGSGLRTLTEKLNEVSEVCRARGTAASDIGALANEVSRLGRSIESLAAEVRALGGRSSSKANVSLGLIGRQEPIAAAVAEGRQGALDNQALTLAVVPAVPFITVGTVRFRKHLSLCLRGYTLLKVQAVSAVQCAEQCHQNSRCASFSYYNNNASCELKNPVSLETFRNKAKEYDSCSFYFADCPMQAKQSFSSNGTVVNFFANSGHRLDDAQNYCAERRQHVVEPRNLAIKSLLETSSRKVQLRGALSNYYWLNAEREDVASSDAYVWSSDKAAVAQYFWAAGQPDATATVKNCLTMEIGKGVVGGWYKESCGFEPRSQNKKKYGTICQCNDFSFV